MSPPGWCTASCCRHFKAFTKLILKATVDDLKKIPKQPPKQGLAEQTFARAVLYVKMVGAEKAIDDYTADRKPAPVKKAVTKKTAQTVKKFIFEKRDIFVPLGRVHC